MTDHDPSAAAGGISQQLDGARRQLADLQDLVAGANASVRQAHGLFCGATELTALADPDVLEQDGLGLRPWLDALSTTSVAGGRAVDVARGLARWRLAAEQVDAAARTVTATNTAPLDRRRELRGRLDATHAKAVRLGLTEDEGLSRLYARAFGTLYRAPTDLALAEELTMAYLRALDGHERPSDHGHGHGGVR